MDEKNLITPTIFPHPPPHWKYPVGQLAKSKIDVGGLKVGFQRTCRVPYDKVNMLPANLGSFPLYKVNDFESKDIERKVCWDKNDYFMPMYQCEALWLNFDRYGSRTKGPYATMVGSGKINAVTGKQIDEYKLEDTQNYVVIPPQPWLDGWKDTDGKVYQFVAAELGSGETVEGQITGEEKEGGIQISVFKSDQDMIPESTPRDFITAGGWQYKDWSWPHYRYKNPFHGKRYDDVVIGYSASPRIMALSSISSMGLGRGGQIKQKIYDDPYGLEVWNEEPVETRTVHIVNSKDFKELTGSSPPPTPISHKTYQRQGYPWFDIWDKELQDTVGSDVFSELKPVTEK